MYSLDAGPLAHSHSRDIVDLYDYRKLLECYAAEKLAQTASHEQIKELAAILAPEQDAAASLQQILSANQTFHRRLSELAGNQRVIGQLNLTLGYVTRLDTLCTQTVPGWIGHAEILRAIERREPSEARHAMQVHVDASRDKMVKLFSA
jgi:DNA-binding GntR family transcriptional regulator